LLPGDWQCPKCQDHQFARNTQCRRCGTARPIAEETQAQLERSKLAGLSSPEGREEVTQFVQKWGINSRCEQMIRTAPTSVAQKAMADFSPAEGTTNVSGRFASFFKQRKVVWKNEMAEKMGLLEMAEEQGPLEADREDSIERAKPRKALNDAGQRARKGVEPEDALRAALFAKFKARFEEEARKATEQLLQELRTEHSPGQISGCCLVVVVAQILFLWCSELRINNGCPFQTL